ncbi:uncharacterized protein LOC123537274 [Mercenaria mercenaria]|uniref:uncharacterized protein LOC123537274 n=1 Tax=Mercenaria mercenaria TaxID=6596 RepID=UPI00234F9B83|nr:uncharacterized protein LOC123537274 [Mercenaria mercenaria]
MLCPPSQRTSRRIQHRTILLYSKRQDDLMKMVEKELKHWLNLRIRNVIFTSCDNVNNREPTSPLLVMCISTSRVAADAINAVKEITELDNTALVVFHHKDVHALSFIPSRRALSDSPFAALNNRIYDIAFLQEKGIYHCNFNDKAITDIATFLKQKLEQFG